MDGVCKVLSTVLCAYIRVQEVLAIITTTTVALPSSALLGNY